MLTLPQLGALLIVVAASFVSVICVCAVASEATMHWFCTKPPPAGKGTQPGSRGEGGGTAAPPRQAIRGPLLIMFSMLLVIAWAIKHCWRFARRQWRAIFRIAPRLPESENDEYSATPPIVFLLLRPGFYYISVTLASIPWLYVRSGRAVRVLAHGVRCAIAAFLLLGWLPLLVGVAVGSITIAPLGLFAGKSAAFLTVLTLFVLILRTAY